MIVLYRPLGYVRDNRILEIDTYMRSSKVFMQARYSESYANVTAIKNAAKTFVVRSVVPYHFGFRPYAQV